MARLLFAKGVRGEIVRKVQRRLTDLGFDPKGVDGDFGDATREAVQAFRGDPAARQSVRRCGCLREKGPGFPGPFWSERGD